MEATSWDPLRCQINAIDIDSATPAIDGGSVNNIASLAKYKRVLCNKSRFSSPRGCDTLVGMSTNVWNLLSSLSLLMLSVTKRLQY